ncbi:MAG: NADH-quinone oxidoreductase subunit NuoE [Candidatus Cloacimonetes bacterium]|nr:NADH-quinone oxidoreductase subunit NuoE [Candidatus Cloacimonadota bacterium]
MSNLELDRIISSYEGKKGVLIPLLQDAQKLEGYLSKEIMRYVAEHSDIRLADIYGVATFYTMFRLKPQGKHIIRVCKGTACHVSDAGALLDSLRDELGLTEGEDTTADGNFTVMEVACLGCCSLAPVIMVDATTYGKLTVNKVAGILKNYK